MLELYGDQQWWAGLGEAGADNVVILPGVSLIEAQQFVDILYGRQNTNEQRKRSLKSIYLWNYCQLVNKQ